MATIKIIISTIYMSSHPNACTIISFSYKYSSPHARSPVWFSRGIGLSGTGFPKNLHKGSQPSFKFQTSKFSGGIVALTFALWASYLVFLINRQMKLCGGYLCFIPGSVALIALTIVLTDQLFIITAGSENWLRTRVSEF